MIACSKPKFFFGSTLLHKELGSTEGYWGDDNWHNYPLTSLMAGDKVLFHQHNLDGRLMTTSLEILSWSLANGFMLAHMVENYPNSITAWLGVATLFQSRVASHYAGERMTDYVELQDKVTQSTFPSVSVTTNWNESSSFSIESHTIPPRGSLVTANDGSLTAGIFNTYHGSALTAGEHYLIIERFLDVDSIKVWQPLGADTPISIERPTAWSDSGSIKVFAVGENDASEVSKSITSHSITFNLNREISGTKFKYYVLVSETVPSSVGDSKSSTPTAFLLFQNYPNPFNPSTTISYQLPQSGQVTVSVFNITGQLVETLRDGHQKAGYHSIIWHADGVGSGIYFYTTKTDEYVASKKCILMK